MPLPIDMTFANPFIISLTALLLAAGPSKDKTAITEVYAVRTSKRPALDGMTDTTGRPWSKYIDLDTYLKPFWKQDTITDEIVQPVKDSAGRYAVSALLFKAKKILSVKSVADGKAFERGKDWLEKDGKLYFGPGSAVPFLKRSELLTSQQVKGMYFPGKAPGTFVLAAGGDYLNVRELWVTYVKSNAAKWLGPVPEFAGPGLPNTLNRLKGGRPLKIVFYGNSIEVGHNASGVENRPPFMPSWADLLVYNLRKHYPGDIRQANTSVSGKLAAWGLDSVQMRVNDEHPDLVIIGFGMNDGTFKVAPDVYRNEIKAIIDAVRAKNSRAEFILIAPMLANPLSGFDGTQALYKAELDKLRAEGIIVADITGVHRELLRHKTYEDMTGNNINHPNDYLCRWYAQYISGLLIK